MKKFVGLFAFFLIVGTSSAHAVCNSPSGAAGDQIYNSSHNVMQYCNGSQWIAMGSGGGGGGGGDTLGALACNSGESIEYDGTNWGCVGGKVSRAGDTMTGTLDVATPTAGTHATTKAYVDAAITAALSGVSGGSSGGSGCYYTAGTCGTGYNQMSGTFRNDGVTHNVCCAGGSALGDDTPVAFDFPASPALAYNASHTWTPVEMTGFDSATISIATTPGAGTGEYRVCADAACTSEIKGWRTTSTGITAGNYVQIRIGAYTTLRTGGAKITVTVGASSDNAEITSTHGAYYIAFVSSGAWNGSMGGISGADAKCQSAATAAGFFGTFRAWIADSSGSSAPATRFENAGTAAKFVKTQGTSGTKIADSWADLIDGSLDAALNYTEGGASASTTVFTNVNTNGTQNTGTSDGTCVDWTSTTGSGNPQYGDSSSATPTWTASGNASNCSTTRRLYCFQTVLPN